MRARPDSVPGLRVEPRARPRPRGLASAAPGRSADSERRGRAGVDPPRPPAARTRCRPSIGSPLAARAVDRPAPMRCCDRVRRFRATFAPRCRPNAVKRSSNAPAPSSPEASTRRSGPARSVGADPVFIRQRTGARVTDADGNEYLDLIGSWGPLILGHAHPNPGHDFQDVIGAGARTFGAPTEIEVVSPRRCARGAGDGDGARGVRRHRGPPMSALRLARGFHRPAADHQGRWRLPRPRRLPAGRRRSGAATLASRARRACPRARARDTVVVRTTDLASVGARAGRRATSPR